MCFFLNGSWFLNHWSSVNWISCHYEGVTVYIWMLAAQSKYSFWALYTTKHCCVKLLATSAEDVCTKWFNWNIRMWRLDIWFSGSEKALWSQHYKICLGGHKKGAGVVAHCPDMLCKFSISHARKPWRMEKILMAWQKCKVFISSQCKFIPLHNVDMDVLTVYNANMFAGQSALVYRREIIFIKVVLSQGSAKLSFLNCKIEREREVLHT